MGTVRGLSDHVSETSQTNTLLKPHIIYLFYPIFLHQLLVYSILTFTNSFFLSHHSLDWLQENDLSVEFEYVHADLLANYLRRFYAEARQRNGEVYSKSGYANIRSAIHRHITSAPYNRTIKYLSGSSL